MQLSNQMRMTVHQVLFEKKYEQAIVNGREGDRIYKTGNIGKFWLFLTLNFYWL